MTTLQLTPSLDSDGIPFMDVLVDNFDAGVASATVVRTVKRRNFTTRGLYQQPTTGILSVQDYEAPMGVDASYRVTQYDAGGNFLSYSAPQVAQCATLGAPANAVWHSPLDPSTAVQVMMMGSAAQSLVRPSALQTFQIPGRSVGLGMHSTRAGYTGLVLDCYTADDEDADAFDLLFGDYDDDTSPIVCIRTHPDLRLPPTLFAQIASPGQNPFTEDPDGGATWSVTGDEVQPPLAAFVAPLLDYADFSAFYTSYAGFTAAYPDYTTAQRDYSIEGTA